jgi:hypothetical protein
MTLKLASFLVLVNANIILELHPTLNTVLLATGRVLPQPVQVKLDFPVVLHARRTMTVPLGDLTVKADIAIPEKYSFLLREKNIIQMSLTSSASIYDCILVL